MAGRCAVVPQTTDGLVPYPSAGATAGPEAQMLECTLIVMNIIIDASQIWPRPSNQR